MAEARADFHVHDDHPADPQSADMLLGEAIENQTYVVGLLQRTTLHTDRAKELVVQGASRRMRVVPGVEIPFKTTGDPATFYELIIHGLDLRNPTTFKFFDPRGEINKPLRDQRVAQQIGYLQDALGIDPRKVEDNLHIWNTLSSYLTGTSAYELCLAAVLNPENRTRLSDLSKLEAELIRQHYQNRPEDSTPDRAASLAKYLYWGHFAPGRPGHRVWATANEPTAQQTIDLAHALGGTVVAAHPKAQYVGGARLPMEIIDSLFDIGIDGLEVWNCGPRDEELAEICYQRGKLTLGGSGRSLRYDNRRIGIGDKHLANMDMSTQVFRDFDRYRKRHGLIRSP